jgi:predicted membrane channel-forming protein YqfA (hemolysin III family)
MISLLRKNLTSLLLLLLAAGFATTLGELLITGHNEGIQLVAVISSTLGIIGALIPLFVSSGWLRTLAVVCFVLITLSGITGTLQHSLNSGGPGNDPPPLAPLALTGIGAMGLLVVLARNKNSTVEIA